MLKKRIIPILLFDGKYCVQTTRFDRPPRRLGPIDQFVNNMGRRNVDELMIIDITATEEGRKINFKQIKSFTKNLFCPVTYGGGIKKLDDIKALIQGCGIDKVAIKTNVHLVEEAAKKFGSQSIVYAIDCYKHHSDGAFFTHRQYKHIGPSNFASYIQDKGAGEILLTSMDKQGLMKGYSNTLIYHLSSDNRIKIPLIANGGCGSINDMKYAFDAGADAVAASTIFALTEMTPADAARGLLEAGVKVRAPLTHHSAHRRQR